MKDDFSNYMVDLDGHFFIIRNVPCHKLLLYNMWHSIVLLGIYIINKIWIFGSKMIFASAEKIVYNKY